MEQRDTLCTSKEMRPVLRTVNILRNTALHYYLEGLWLCRELKTCCWLGHQLSHGETMEKKNKMTRSLNATPPGHPREQWAWIWNELEFLYFVEMNESIRSASLLFTNGPPWRLRWWRVRLQCGRPRFNPWVGKIPWKGHGNPLQYSCLKNPHRQRSLAGYSPWSCKEPDTTKQLSRVFVINNKAISSPFPMTTMARDGARSCKYNVSRIQYLSPKPCQQGVQEKGHSHKVCSTQWMHLLQNIVRTLRDAHAWRAFGNADYKTTIQKSRIHRKPRPLNVVIEPMSEVSFFEHKWMPQSGVIPAMCYVDLEVYKVSLFIKILPSWQLTCSRKLNIALTFPPPNGSFIVS